MTMTELDHSSAVSLLADLDWHDHRGSVFYFKYRSGGTTVSWRLLSASPRADGHVLIEYEYGHDAPVFCDFRLVDGWLVSSDAPVGVKVVAGGGRGGFMDDSLCRRLDDNLRRVFS